MEIKVEQLSDDDVQAREITSWPIWTKDVSRFDWHYDEQEQCLFLEGDVVVETDQGNVEIKKGDFVTFPQGLSCVWDVKQPVRKHYKFG